MEKKFLSPKCVRAVRAGTAGHAKKINPESSKSEIGAAACRLPVPVRAEPSQCRAVKYIGSAGIEPGLCENRLKIETAVDYVSRARNYTG